MTSEKSTSGSPPLPAFLTQEEAQEIEQIPLQVLLLTMEVREHRLALMRLTEALESLARAAQLPRLDFEE
jgi:hypothetical protein